MDFGIFQQNSWTFEYLILMKANLSTFMVFKDPYEPCLFSCAGLKITIKCASVKMTGLNNGLNLEINLNTHENMTCSCKQSTD